MKIDDRAQPSDVPWEMFFLVVGGVVEDGFSLQPKQQIKGWPSQNGDKRNASLISYGLTCNVHGIAPSYWLDVATRKIRRPMSPQPPNA
ncbi:hypothetical protein OUZ56_007681 [Daphnia magna]|uniref:Uncharacterized protein n=1 Tax=Daphnia magna TaxID=35525 RepID=A0ABR0AAQ1_9CRUS|nr:hypothetical protein OUZ56_007681 [Daphnia magna]